MVQISISGSAPGNSLQELLIAKDIVPGDQISYQTCKAVLEYHPLGYKMAYSPVKMAQSQSRTIVVPDSPEEQVKEAFEKEWIAVGATRHIGNTVMLSRAYGIASIAVLGIGNSDEPLNFDKLYNSAISFNVFDPLNTAGSLVLNQDPNAFDFQKSTDIWVNGQRYHRSRTVVVMNEDPIYISYTSSGFGFVGRSVYQRALFPLKSFIQTLRTDDMVVRKAGVLIAMMKQVGSVIDNIQQRIFGQKRDMLKEAETDNVLSIGEADKIETLNMQNLDGAYGMARDNILKNIATAADMPAKLLDNETLVEGFGEGSEDAKQIARYISGVRETMAPLYDFFDQIVMHRAWNPDFYKTIQRQFPDEWGDVDYQTAFYRWKNSFRAIWPNLLEEPDSEKAKTDDVRLKAMIEAVETLAPMLDPINKAKLIDWVCENFSSLKILFPNPIELDMDELITYLEKQAANMGGPDEGEDDMQDLPAVRLDSRPRLALAKQ